MDRISFEKDDEVDVSWLINQLFFFLSAAKKASTENYGDPRYALLWKSLVLACSPWKSLLNINETQLSSKRVSSKIGRRLIKNHIPTKVFRLLRNCDIIRVTLIYQIQVDYWTEFYVHMVKYNTLYIRKTRHSMNTCNV